MASFVNIKLTCTELSSKVYLIKLTALERSKYLNKFPWLLGATFCCSRSLKLPKTQLDARESTFLFELPSPSQVTGFICSSENKFSERKMILHHVTSGERRKNSAWFPMRNRTSDYWFSQRMSKPSLIALQDARFSCSPMEYLRRVR